LTQYGFRAVISTSFADIFKQNSLKNSLLPIVVPHALHAELFANRNIVVKVDLASQKLALPDGRAIEFPIDAFAKHCLLEGIDELGYILNQSSAIAAFEASHPAPIDTLAGS
jgi:3-isopropylmalate/(R)-2-methylmalate dehydratase small subunit